ncbi:hypothetical protein ACA910_005790 [Epithemia clementina (nom. ined.)]
MTANEPATITWTSDRESSGPRMDAASLEIGMAGMSLVSGLQDSRPSRKETGSTCMSSTPPDDDTNGGSRSQRNTTAANLDPPSPGSNSNTAPTRSYVSRPPGMGPHVPSPIGKPGHAKTSSNTTATTSPLLTLTPNSSVDGNSEWPVRQPSPEEVPSIPFLSSEHRRFSGDTGGDTGSMGSYEHDEPDNDGLLGLGALRERTYSTGSSVSGRFSCSPPVARGHLPAHEMERRRDRPPLSHSYSEGVSNQGDRNSRDRNTGSTSASMHSQQNSGFESGDPRGFGAIARPELRQSTSDYDPSFPGSGNMEGFMIHPNGSAVFEQGHYPQKYGPLSSAGTHVQQQQRGFLALDLSKPRHGRPVPQHSHNAPSNMSMDPRAYSPQQFSVMARGINGSAYPTGHGSFETPAQYSSQKRNSLPNFSSNAPAYSHLQHPGLERRDALDFMTTHHNVMTDEMRLMGNPAMVSPGHSPHQIHYARHQSDASSTMMSSHMSVGNVMVRNHSVPIPITRQSSMGDDDDLHQTLIGESIDVHSDPYGDTQYMLSQSAGSLPMMRPHGHSGHSHSLSLGEVPNHYMDAGSHHLPTAGAALPLPKVVYSVKFKRTQRNFVLGPRITRDLKIGTYVKVEADRGEDLGIVVGKVPADKFNFASRTQYTAGMGPPGGMGGSSAADLKRIIRLATHDEVSLLGIKREEEDELLKICRGKVRLRGLPMNVVDAEYQFDRHKLTFFFEAEGRVDFRELVRDLFSMYKTRIWMQQLDKNTSTSAPAIIAPQANLQMDYGTPIIAPASEFADSLPLNGIGC